MRFSALILVLSFVLPTFAYIPKAEMIIERLGRNHGYGFFLIDQEVIFPGDPNPYIVKEQWLINTDGSYRLRVKGERQLKDKLDITIVYTGDRKYYINSSGTKKVTSVGSDFADRLFFTSNKDKLKREIKRFGIQWPNQSELEKLKDPEQKGTVNPGRSEYLNLTRVGGRVAYAIGELTPFSNSDKFPMIWVEQDQFNILKVRLPSQVEISANGYSRYGRGMMYPKSRVIQTPTESFQINLRQVRTANSNSANKKLLSHTSLDPVKSPHVVLTLPDVEVIKNFYQRFR